MNYKNGCGPFNVDPLIYSLFLVWYELKVIPLRPIFNLKRLDMAGYISDDTRKVTTHRLIEISKEAKKYLCLQSMTTQWHRLSTVPVSM